MLRTNVSPFPSAALRTDTDKAYGTLRSRFRSSAFYTQPSNGHETAKTRGCVSRDTILSLTFKLGQSAAKRWRRLRGYQWLERLEQGVTFVDGIEQTTESNDHRSAA